MEAPFDGLLSDVIFHNVDASFTLPGTELHTLGSTYLSECFPKKETVLNLGVVRS